MKAIDRISLIFVLFSLPIFIALDPCFSKDNFPFKAEVTKSPVNVRAGASANFEILYKLKKEDKVKVVDKKFSWYKIGLPKGKVNFFINQQYLQASDQNAGTVLKDRVNLRVRPNTSATVIAQVNKGDVLNIVSKDNDWFCVQSTDKCFGWIKQEFLKYVSEWKDEVEIKVEPQVVAQPTTPTAIIAAPTSEVKTQAVDKDFVDITGKVEAIGRIFGFPVKATHKLITPDKVYYLKADKDFLNNFLFQKVKVRGKISDASKKIPIITVEKIELAS